MSILKNDEIRNQVRTRYAEVANAPSGCCGSGGGCCSSNPQESTKLGYSTDDVDQVPEGANMGLGCGNPQAIASLKDGETVVDLGSGGGFDSFLAARQVGETGKVIGVDMTPDMVSKARQNAEKGGYNNVEFRLGEIENLPVADNSVDVIISNCVINLSPDKQRVFHEAYRVLRNGGRLAISDVIGMGVLPDALKNNDAYCACVSGAGTKEELGSMLRTAGFLDVNIEIKVESKEYIKNWLPQSGVEAYISSAVITARK